jgi:hypothetical protein
MFFVIREILGGADIVAVVWILFSFTRAILRFMKLDLERALMDILCLLR